ncbi:MAG TPA: acyltransferase family protein [Dehalococcoidia bacterium]|nr:acyltransferase family protein [Dehalococcoidia bacterium]
MKIESARGRRRAAIRRRLSCFRPSPPSPASQAKSSYLPGLDGLRALAVIAVLIYHGRTSWLPGGYLGVEVFFVISGFIITRSLLNEWQDRGRINLGAFWLRRARRLLPAVFMVIAATMAYALAFQPDIVASLRSDALAALLYVTNWHLIMGGQSYFDSFARPSMLRHLWSLAVEEQFYLIWPPILFVGLSTIRRWGVFGLVIGGVAASAIGVALIYTSSGDTTRIYYGTDTRAAGLLAGAALALLLAARRTGTASVSRWLLTLVGVASLAGLVAAAFWLDEGQAWLYEGGFLAVSLTTCVAIFAATRTNPFSRIMGALPLRWVGLRSYGIYLWHWPIYMLVWPDQPTMLQFLGLTAVVFVVAALSYALVEQPVRQGALSRLWSRVRDWSSLRWRYRGAVAFSTTGAMALVAGLVTFSVMAKAPEKPAYFDTTSIRIHGNLQVTDVASVLRGPTTLSRLQTTISSLTDDGRTCESAAISPDTADALEPDYDSTCPEPQALFARPAFPETASSVVPSMVGVTSPGESDAAAVGAAQTPPSGDADQLENRANCDMIRGTDYHSPDERQWFLANCIVAPPPAEAPVQTQGPPIAKPPVLTTAPSVTAIGDSVMLGAAYSLAASIPGIDVDAQVGRQVSEAVQLLSQRAASNLLGSVILMDIGNNGTFTSAQFDQIMAIAGTRTVIFVNLHVPRSWQDGNNAVIANGVSRYPNARLVDWKTAGEDEPQVFYSDGLHLTPDGASLYTSLIVAALQ